MTRIFLRNIDPLVVILEHSCIHTDSKKKFFFVTLEVDLLHGRGEVINQRPGWMKISRCHIVALHACNARTCVRVCMCAHHNASILWGKQWFEEWREDFSSKILFLLLLLLFPTFIFVSFIVYWPIFIHRSRLHSKFSSI